MGLYGHRLGNYAPIPSDARPRVEDVVIQAGAVIWWLLRMASAHG